MIINGNAFKISDGGKMKSLDEIAIDCGTDKSSRKHNYTKLYAAYFEPLRQKPIKMLEIGAANGYSLKMWKAYFTKAEILGVDIKDCKELAEDRISIEQGDQSDPKFLKLLNDKYGPFDVIIDDGSHRNPDMKASFDFLFPLLKPDGIYVVEDLHACYWDLKNYHTKETGSATNIQASFIDRLKELVDYVNSFGKSGTANHALDDKDPYHLNNKTKLTWWDDVIEFMHFYRSIVFIKKYPAKMEGSAYIVSMPDILGRTRRKVRFIWRKLSEVKWAKKKAA